MTIDVEIIKAIEAIASELGQSKAVSKRLIAWMEDEANRDIPHADRLEHLQNLRAAIEIAGSH